MEERLRNEPAVWKIILKAKAPADVREGCSLCVQPAQIRVQNKAGWMTDALASHSNAGADQALQGEERHLRVIGDRSFTPIRVGECGNSVRTELAANRSERLEFHRCSQRVADRTSKQAASHPLDPRRAAVEELIHEAIVSPGSFGCSTGDDGCVRPPTQIVGLLPPRVRPCNLDQSFGYARKFPSERTSSPSHW
jgi:hypothetical protein